MDDPSPAEGCSATSAHNRRCRISDCRIDARVRMAFGHRMIAGYFSWGVAPGYGVVSLRLNIVSPRCPPAYVAATRGRLAPGYGVVGIRPNAFSLRLPQYVRHPRCVLGRCRRSIHTIQPTPVPNVLFRRICLGFPKCYGRAGSQPDARRVARRPVRRKDHRLNNASSFGRRQYSRCCGSVPNVVPLVGHPVPIQMMRPR